MKCGIFGKLPSKRDFVVHNMPRPFLGFWENWLQSAVAASRSQLGDDWHTAYLSAPIWRFWIGREVCGNSVAGAVMPSVDRVGRYFPLTICACAPEDARIDPPVVSPMDDWYLPVEEALLRALDENFAGEADELVEPLPFPPLAAAPAHHMEACAVSGSLTLWSPSGTECKEAFQIIHGDDTEKLHAPRSYWWTNGGASHASQIAVSLQMPDPFYFSSFLTGKFVGMAQ